ncbi:MAG TPA: hypothetical protein VGM18_04330 [Candidatus Sulfotelmatobacter sp.]|jgi:hypothetical protein
MKRVLVALIVLYCALGMYAQSPQLEILNPPTSGQSGYNDIFNTLLKETRTGGGNAVAGITVFLTWGAVDNGCEVTACAGETPAVVLAAGQQIGTCLEPDCYWSAIDTELLNYINGPSSNGLASHGQKINLIIVIIPEGQTTNNDVPNYVFQPANYTHSWCTGCSTAQPQDLVTCPAWPGDSNVPTGGSDGVWNVNQCRLTGGGSCSGTDLADVSGGYPVLYEAPFMSAYRIFVQRVLKHYSSAGSGSGPTIGQYLGYIRPGLAEGGENQPLCTTGTVGGTNYGIWPNAKGLSYDLSNSIDPDWFQTTSAYTYPSPCDTYTSCQGKDAYLEGVNNPPGYVSTLFSEMQTDLNMWNADYTTPINIVANTHTGPPGNTDLSYANVEASIFASYGPVSGHGVSGFGMESLSEWDVANAPSNCTQNWCANFTTYSDSGSNPYMLNLYLQTTTPNSEPVFSISSITHTTGASTATVNCTSTCATTGASGGLLKQTQWVKVAGNSGTSGTFTISSVNSSTQFVIGTCGVGGNTCGAGSSGTLYTGDYLPDTIPFAKSYYADTIEVYFCDWEFAFASPPASQCPATLSPYSGDYASVLSNP